MADRRSVFRDPSVVEAARSFTCAADEVWRLQRGSEADCVFFQRAVNGGQRITDRGSRQGFWIFAPSGRLLAHCNTRAVDTVLATFARGLAAFEELEPSERRLAEGVVLEPEHRWERYYPEDGLVLRRIARDLDDAGLDAPPRSGWNPDAVWFARSELVEQVPEALAVGDEFALPQMALRLARFHLVDNARGQTIPYAPREVVRAELAARVLSIDAEGRAQLELSARTLARSAGEWLLGDNHWKPRRELAHALECALLGSALWNARTQRFEAFELVGVGLHEGRTQFNGRGRDASPGLLGFHLALASDAPRVAPTFAAMYAADWIEQPAQATWVESPAECGLEAGE